MFTLKKKFTFEAAHFLPLHDGKCQRLHGHSFIGWVEVIGDHLETDGPKSGMVLDYGDLSAAMKPLVDDYLDHHCLNETLGLESPTSEAIAKWIYEHVSTKVEIDAVTIEETCTSVCTYRPRR